MDSTTGGRHRSRDGEAPGTIWMLAALGLGLVVVASVSLWAGLAARHDRALADEELVANRLFEARAEMAWLHHGLLTDGLVAEATGGELSDPDVAAFRLQRQSIIAELEQLATGSTDEAAIAGTLLEQYAEAPLDTWPFPGTVLDDQHYASVVAGPGASRESDGTGREEILVVTMLPSLVLADAVSVALVERPEGSPPWAADYIEQTVEVVTSQPGWLGPDRNQPLADHVLGPPSDEGELPAVVRNLDADVQADLGLVWDYDQWLIASADADAESDPPLTIGDLDRATTASVDALRAAARNELAEERESILASAPAERAARMWFGLGAAAGAATLVPFVLSAVRVRASRRLLADDASTDHLTGARNRRYLDHVVARRCQRVAYHHLIVMIDLDRFKLVNDTWGHDAGDALLKVMAQRLDEAAQELTGQWEHASTAVVRAGGDEFVVALHCPEEVLPEKVTNRLREIIGPVDLGLDEPIDLEFSLGIASSDTPADLASLLKTADLAAYEDKRMRAAQRQPASTSSEVDAVSTLELR